MISDKNFNGLSVRLRVTYMLQIFSSDTASYNRVHPNVTLMLNYAGLTLAMIQMQIQLKRSECEPVSIKRTNSPSYL